MNVIYSCYGGAHSSVVAAAIHLGILPNEPIPTCRQLMSLDGFDRTDKADHGKVRHVGTDALGNEIYVLGRGPAAREVERGCASGYMLAGGKQKDLIFIDTLVCVNTFMRVGGFLSRRLKWIGVGRPLVLWGTRRAYRNLAQLVDQTYRRLAKEAQPALTPINGSKLELKIGPRRRARSEDRDPPRSLEEKPGSTPK